uniref:Uncharacterized protein n=1 Tax=Alexandrium monilatum TaxID=311494 RepID=A0A7S4QP81_9DINO
MVSVGYLREIGLLDLHSEAPKPRAPLPAAAVAAAPSEPAPAAAGAAKGGKAGKAAEGAAGAPAPASAGDAPAGPPPEELSPEELKKLSKSERTAYYAARRAGGQTPAPKAKQLSKAERRAVQEAQRKVKEDKQSAAMDNAEMLEELKLQGLSEEQAREVMAELLRTEEEQAADEEEDDEPEDLLSSVRKWMSEQDKVPEDALHDFNMKVRFQGHVDTTPPDHLAAILQTITEEACRQCDLKTPKPNAVAKTVEPAVVRWAPLLEPLYAKIGDPMEAADVVVRAVQEGVGALGEVPEAGQACGVVGCLMALREIDMIEDEDLLTGCRRCEPHSRVMEKFIEFLEEELEDEDEEDDGED